MSSAIDDPARLEAVRWYERSGGFSSSLERYARLSAGDRLAGIKATASALAEHGAAVVGANFISLAIADPKRVTFYHGPGVDEVVAKEWASTPLDTPIPMVRAAVVQEPVIVSDRGGFSTWPAMADAVKRLGMQSFAAMPIGDAGFGLKASVGLGFTRPLPGAGLPSSSARLMALTTQALIQAHRSESAEDQANTLKAMVIPSSLPTVSGLAFAGSYLAPITAKRVGGDVYDVVVRDDGGVGIVIADAVGHDLEAAQTADQVRHAAGALTLEGLSPAQLLRSVNRYLLGSDRQRQVTCAYVFVESQAGRGLVATAGNPLPRLISVGGSHPLGMPGDPPLGLAAHRYREQPFSLGPADVLLMFTDGLIGDRGLTSGEREEWLDNLCSGIHRQIEATSGRVSSGRAAAAIDRLVDGVAELEQEDGAAVIAVSRDGAATAPNGAGGLLHRSYAASSIRLSTVRGQVREWLDAGGLSELEPQVSLVVTELMTNAAEASDAAASVELIVDCPSDGGVKVTVTNPGSAFSPTQAMPDIDSERGRGLAIVRDLARSLSVETSQGMVTVAAHIF